MSDSVRPHRQQPIRLLCPWDSPGKNTGVGCHFLLQSNWQQNLSLLPVSTFALLAKTQPVQGSLFKLWNPPRNWRGTEESQSPLSLVFSRCIEIPSVPLKNTAIVLWKVYSLLKQRMLRKTILCCFAANRKQVSPFVPFPLRKRKKKKMKRSLIHVDATWNLYFISSILKNLHQLADQTIFIPYLCWHFPTAKPTGEILTNTRVRGGKKKQKTFHVEPNLLPIASLNISFFGGADVGCNLAQSLRTKMPAPFWKGLISRSHSHLLWNSPMCTYVLLLNSWVCCVCVQKCVGVW